MYIYIQNEYSREVKRKKVLDQTESSEGRRIDCFPRLSIQRSHGCFRLPICLFSSPCLSALVSLSLSLSLYLAVCVFVLIIGELWRLQSSSL